MEIESVLKQDLANVLNALYGQSLGLDAIKLEQTNPDFIGDYTLVAFPYVRWSKLNPEQTANAIGEALMQSSSVLQSFNVVKGFLNLELKQSVWISSILSHQAIPSFPKKEKVMVEYSSPNTNKPLHLGHVRNNLLGSSLANILKANAYEVIQANLINDRGIHICKSMLAWQKFGQNETPESSGMKGDHLVGKYYVEFDKHCKAEIKTLIEQGVAEDQASKQAPLLLEAQDMLRKWEAGDQATITLWKTMNQWVYDGFAKTYKQLGVEFDQYYYESNTYLLGKDLIEMGLEKGVFYKKTDGSTWIDLSADGLDEKLVLRGDGTSVYITQDIGTAQLKYNQYACSKSIYVVGNEQDYHFKVLFLILKKLGFDWANGLYHLSYGMVDLPSGKMKSREGTVVDADDLMSEMIQTAKEKTEELGKTSGMSDEEKTRLYHTLGMGALKFFMLKVDPQKRMLFNPAESIDFQGDTGPFVQYTYARINSIMRSAQAEDKTIHQVPSAIRASEVQLIQTVLAYKQELQKAAQSYSPSIIANYLLQLAKAFNRLYNDVSILKAIDANERAFRLHLSALTAETIQHGLSLLGVNSPERM